MIVVTVLLVLSLIIVVVLVMSGAEQRQALKEQRKREKEEEKRQKQKAKVQKEQLKKQKKEAQNKGYTDILNNHEQLNRNQINSNIPIEEEEKDEVSNDFFKQDVFTNNKENKTESIEIPKTDSAFESNLEDNEIFNNQDKENLEENQSTTFDFENADEINENADEIEPIFDEKNINTKIDEKEDTNINNSFLNEKEDKSDLENDLKDNSKSKLNFDLADVFDSEDLEEKPKKEIEGIDNAFEIQSKEKKEEPIDDFGILNLNEDEPFETNEQININKENKKTDKIESSKPIEEDLGFLNFEASEDLPDLNADPEETDNNKKNNK